MSTLYTSLNAQNKHVIKATGARLKAFYVHNVDSATHYLQFFNKEAPINDDVPILSFKLAAGEKLLVGAELFDDLGVAFNTALAYGDSSTPAVLTLATTELFLHVWYV